jgi:hypothetical protein
VRRVLHLEISFLQLVLDSLATGAFVVGARVKHQFCHRCFCHWRPPDSRACFQFCFGVVVFVSSALSAHAVPRVGHVGLSRVSVLPPRPGFLARFFFFVSVLRVAARLGLRSVEDFAANPLPRARFLLSVAASLLGLPVKHAERVHQISAWF